jgi:[ribosomal protein S5]-alanine N-acetyltransferase
MKEPFESARLMFRRPERTDAQALYDAFCADPEVTRWLSWHTHRNLDDTLEFLDFSAAEWARAPSGPLLIHSRKDGSLLGSTGLAFEEPHRAATGYVLKKSAWGKGYATEALRAMVTLAASLNVVRLYALCHVEHAASKAVLRNGGLNFEGILRAHTVFPNAGTLQPEDVCCFARILNQSPR